MASGAKHLIHPNSPRRTLTLFQPTRELQKPRLPLLEYPGQKRPINHPAFSTSGSGSASTSGSISTLTTGSGSGADTGLSPGNDLQVALVQTFLHILLLFEAQVYKCQHFFCFHLNFPNLPMAYSPRQRPWATNSDVLPLLPLSSLSRAKGVKSSDDTFQLAMAMVEWTIWQVFVSFMVTWMTQAIQFTNSMATAVKEIKTHWNSWSEESSFTKFARIFYWAKCSHSNSSSSFPFFLFSLPPCLSSAPTIGPSIWGPKVISTPPVEGENYCKNDAGERRWKESQCDEQK